MGKNEELIKLVALRKSHIKALIDGIIGERETFLKRRLAWATERGTPISKKEFNSILLNDLTGAPGAPDAHDKGIDDVEWKTYLHENLNLGADPSRYDLRILMDLKDTPSSDVL